MKTINSEKEYDEVLANHALVCMIFSSRICPDCFYTDMYTKHLVANYPNIKFMKVTRAKLYKRSEALSIIGVPSFILYNHQNIIGTFISKDRKTFIEVTAFIDQTLKEKR